MNSIIDFKSFGREFAGWLGRGMLYASPSVFWAGMVGFTQPAEIAAIVLCGVMFVALVSLYCSWRSSGTAGDESEFVRALKIAMWVKIVPQAVALALLVLSSELRFRALECSILAFFPDMLDGFVSLSIVSRLAGLRDLQLAQLDSFGWTALTSVLQGLLLTVLLVILAWCVIAGKKAWCGMGRERKAIRASVVKSAMV